MNEAASNPGWSRLLLFLSALVLVCCGAGAERAPVGAPSAPAPVEAAAYAEVETEGAEPGPEAPEEGLASKGEEDKSASPPPPPPAAAPGTGVPPRKSPELGGSPPTSELPQSATRASEPGVEKRSPLLIYTATVTMAVFGTAQALDAVEALALSRKGYLVRRTDTSITIRVPTAVFEATLKSVGGLGDELHREVEARDVTEEYADLEIRLRNAEVVRQRLEALLSKAARVEDALAVERELTRVTEHIERLKGRLKLLSELVQFSTITVNFEPRAVEHVNPEVPLPFDWLRELGLQNLLSL